MPTIRILGPGDAVLSQAHSACTVQKHIMSMCAFSENGTLRRSSMHPPAFCLDQRLSDWPKCFLELQCCKGVTLMPVRLLLSQHGDRTFKTLIKQLRCDRCGKAPPRFISVPPIFGGQEAWERWRIGRSSWWARRT